MGCRARVKLSPLADSRLLSHPPPILPRSRQRVDDATAGVNNRVEIQLARLAYCRIARFA